MKNITKLFYFFAVSLPLVFQANIHAQTDPTNVEVTEGYVFVKNNATITLDDSYIRIANPDETFFDQAVTGLKQTDFSKDNNYMLITSFDFPESEENFKIYGLLFNNEFELVDKLEADAYYGMPHPLFRVNNEGVVTIIDPQTMRLEIRDGGKNTTVEFEEGIPFEMERQIYIDSDEKGVYVLYNRELIPIEENNPEFTLARYDFNTGEVAKSEISISSVTYCGIMDEKIIISGVKFEESVPTPISMRVNERLEIINETRAINFEGLVKFNGLLVGTFNKSLVVFNENFDKTSEKYLTGEGKYKRVFILNGKLGIMIEEDGMLWIYTSTNDNAEFDVELPQAILSFNNFERFVNVSDCYIHSNNQTFIIK